MATIKFLTGSSLDGASVTISAEKAGFSAGPETKSNWGTVLAASEITGLSITKTEYATNFAPHMVEFEADYSACSFDTPHPTLSTDYDHRFHDLDIYWVFDDAGTFDYLDRVPDSYKNKNFATGGYVSHCFVDAGSYTVSCVAFERSSGKFSQASILVTVNSQATHFPTTQTICIYPTGGTAGTVPSGALTVEADSLLDTDTHYTTNESGEKRFLFQRGGSYDVKISPNQVEVTGMVIGAYGTGADPILTIDIDGSSNPTMFEAQYLEYFKVENITARGLYNPAVGDRQDLDDSTFALNFLQCLDSKQTVISGCDIRGFSAGTLGVSAINSATPVRCMFFNLFISDFGGQYPAFLQPSTVAGSTINFIGVAAIQREDAVSHDGNFRSFLRHNNSDRLHIRGFEIFHRDPTQAAIKLFNGNGGDRRTQRATVQNLALESFAGQIAVGTNENNAQRINIRISNVITIGQYRTFTGICNTELTGLTLENALHCTPNVGRNGINSRNAVAVELNNLTADSAAAPINYRSITYGMLRTLEVNGSEPVFLSAIGTDGTFPVTVNVDNCITHIPEFGTVPFAPLDETTVLFQSRNTYGFIPVRGIETGTLASNVAAGATYDLTLADTSIYQDFISVVRESQVNGTSRTATYSIVDATTIRITNTSGVQWNSGESYSFQFVWANDIVHPVDTVTATPANSVVTLKPLATSPALSGATAPIPRRSVATNALRPEGSEDIGAWQVST